MAFGLYLHIPFCKSKCNYCDFYSLGQRSAVPEEYITALLRELHRYENCECARLRPDTLYLGGGTPSLLTPAQAARLIDAASPVSGAEITLEANPDTVTLESLQGYRAAGVNRLSFGVQSARDEQLLRLGRSHTATGARNAFRLAQQAGFCNISGDVMLALPHYTRAELQETLALLCEGGAVHISSYLLKLEPHTRFGLHPPAGLPSEDEAADFYLACVEQLAALGFVQYEISNFAKPGYESRHNLIYWELGDYLGLGPAAYSCMGGKRFHYAADLSAFTARIAPVIQDEPADALEYLMLQLRLSHGLNTRTLTARYGIALSKKQLQKIGLYEKAGFCRFQDGILSLTPKGFLVQNSILTELF